MRRAGELRTGGRLWSLVDAVVLAALITVAAVAFQPAYGGRAWLLATAAGAGLGGLLSWLVLAVFRAHGVFLVIAVAVGYFVVGPAVATPDYAGAGVFPTLETVRLLALAVVTSWRQMLTVAVPVGSSGALLVPVFLPALVFASVAGAIAIRSRRASWALALPMLMLCLAAVLGTHDGYLPLVSGGTVALGGLAFASLVRRRHGLAGFDLRRPVSALVVIAAAVAAMAYLGAPAAPASPRIALRDSVVPPFDPAQYPSPLAGFRALVKDDAARKAELFTIAGLPAGAHIRLASLDQYNGVLFNVSETTGTFARVGMVIDNSASGTNAAVTVTMGKYSGVYLPAYGSLTGITFTGPRSNDLTMNFRYAAVEGVGIETGGVSAGDGYQFTALIPAEPTDDAVRGLSLDTTTGLVAPAKIPDVVRTAAGKAAEGQDTAGAKIIAVRDAIRNGGHLSHGDTKAGEKVSASGHGLDRIAKLIVDKQMVGDQEQFAPAVSLMLWSLGIPNRVVMGFAPTEKHDTAAFMVTGGDASAWVEVPTNAGWVVVDPTPNNQQTPPKPTPKAQAQPKPQVLQPPPPPPAPAQANSSSVDQSKTGNDDKKDKIPPQASSALGALLWTIGLSVGIPLLLISTPIGLILWLKARRRRRRRTAERPPDRISGGWSEVVDAAADLGHRVALGYTRSECAAELDSRFGGSTLLLARQADTRVFSSADVDEASSAAFWSEVELTLVEMGAGQSRLRRLLARLSTRSLRRRDRML